MLLQKSYFDKTKRWQRVAEVSIKTIAGITTQQNKRGIIGRQSIPRKPRPQVQVKTDFPIHSQDSTCK